MSRLWVLGFISLALCGCMKTVSRPVAAYRPGAAPPTTQPVPRTAVYSIRFLDEKGKKWGGVPGSHRLLNAGDHVGFELTDSGSIVAIAANEKLPVDAPPGQGMVWSTTYQKTTQFSKEMAKAASGTAKVVGAGTGIFLKSTLENFLRDDEDDDVRVRAGYSSRQRH